MSAAASRQRLRRHRARQREGLVCLTVEIEPAVLEEALLRAGLLREDQLDDRAALTRGVENVLHIWASETRFYTRP